MPLSTHRTETGTGERNELSALAKHKSDITVTLENWFKSVKPSGVYDHAKMSELFLELLAQRLLSQLTTY